MKKFLGSALLIFLCLTLVIGIFVVARNREDDLPNSTQSGTLQESTSDTGNPNDSSSVVKPPSDNASDVGADDPPSSVPPDDNSGDSQENSSSSGSGNEEDSGEVIPPDSSEPPVPDDGDDSSQSSGDSGSDSSDNEEDEPQEPIDYSAYIADGVTMNPGAAVYLGDDQGTTMRFTGYVSAEMKSAVDSGKAEVAFLVAPMDYFDGVNPENHLYMDWVTEFEKADKTVLYTVVSEGNYQPSGDEYLVAFQLRNIMYKNINRKYVCILAVKTSEGYRYGTYLGGENYRTAARSVAYVAAASLNAYALGWEDFSTEEVANLKGYINQSVDCANGKETATNDGSMYAFTTNITAPQRLVIGESFTLTTTVIPDVEIPVWYQSTDESIIYVDDNGKVVAKAKGTAVVGVYVAGEAFGITVTVS